MGVEFHHIRTRMKISDSKKRQIAEQGGFSKEHKKKMSESARKRHKRIRLMEATLNFEK